MTMKAHNVTFDDSGRSMHIIFGDGCRYLSPQAAMPAIIAKPGEVGSVTERKGAQTMTIKSGDKTTKKCLYCHTPLTGKQRNYCSDAHRKAHKREEERIENLPPQAKISPNPDNLRIPDIDLSGLVSDFTDNELMDFAAHILSMAEYEHVWFERTLEDLARTPGQKHINDPIPPEYRRLTRILDKYQRSEAIFRWIGDKVQDAIGRKVKAYRSPCYGGMEFQVIDGKTIML